MLTAIWEEGFTLRFMNASQMWHLTWNCNYCDNGRILFILLISL
jgi:hypothetical protein